MLWPRLSELETMPNEYRTQQHQYWSNEHSDVRWTSEQQVFKCCMKDWMPGVQMISMIYR